MRARLRTVARDESGFGLIEALVAAAVMLVGVLALVGAFDDSRDLSATAERHELAVFQAEQALEEMRGIPYENLMMNAGAAEPAGAGRVTGAGAGFQVKPDLSERLVYYSENGDPVDDAWVTPTSTVSLGANDGPELEMTIHRFVTWRDEECRVADLSQLGVQLPDAIDDAQVPLVNLVDNVLSSLLGLLSGGDRTVIANLRDRLDELDAAFLGGEGELGDTLSGLAELDLCDIELSALQELQNLVPPNLTAVGQLTGELESLVNAAPPVCILGICLLSDAQDAAIADVTAQLDCMYGAGSGEADFDAYLAGLTQSLGSLPGDLGDTADENTKRITVAVVVEPRAGVGPFEPVWATSVMRDPAVGFVSGGGALC